MKAILVCVSLTLLLTSVVVHAQGVGSSGDIRGTVTDASGAVLPKATVIAVDAQTGLRRTALTDSTGQFQLAGLSPATYDVTAQVSSFGTEIQEGVVVYFWSDGHRGFPDETVTGIDCSPGYGRAGCGGHGKRGPSGQHKSAVHQPATDQPPRLPYFHLADAGRG